MKFSRNDGNINKIGNQFYLNKQTLIVQRLYNNVVTLTSGYKPEKKILLPNFY